MMTRRPVRKRVMLMMPMVLIALGLAINGLAFQNSPDESQTVPAAVAAAAPRYVDPLFNLDHISEAFHKQPDPNEDKRFAAFERDLRESVASGWRPPWSDLEIKMTDEQIAALSTEELAKACFASGLPARTSLLYSNPNVSFQRLEVLYKGFGELFGRSDAWKIPIAVLDLYLGDLEAQSKADGNVNAIMGLSTLPELYGYSKVRRRIAGHEKEIIAAHIQGLEKINAYLDSKPFSSTKPDSRPIFSVTAPIALVCWAMVLGQDVSAEQYDVAHAALSQYKWLPDDNPRSVKPFIDRAIEELKPFVE